MGGRSKAVRKAVQETPLDAPMAIPCHKGHHHDWPTEGPITMEHVGRCQVYCQFCALNIKNPILLEAKWGWYLRRHVYQVHRKEFPNLIVPEEWSGSKATSKGKVGPKKSGGKPKKTTKKDDAEVDLILAMLAAEANSTALAVAGAVEKDGNFDLTSFDALGTNLFAPDTIPFAADADPFALGKSGDPLLAGWNEPVDLTMPAAAEAVYDNFNFNLTSFDAPATNPFAPGALDEPLFGGVLMGCDDFLTM